MNPRRVGSTLGRRSGRIDRTMTCFSQPRVRKDRLAARRVLVGDLHEEVALVSRASETQVRNDRAAMAHVSPFHEGPRSIPDRARPRS